MKSFSRSMPMLALAAAAALVSASVAYVGDTITRASIFVSDVFGTIVLRVFGGPEVAKDKAPTASLRGFVVHKAHQFRQLKRQAPRIEDSWRMCPSV